MKSVTAMPQEHHGWLCDSGCCTTTSSEACMHKCVFACMYSTCTYAWTIQKLKWWASRTLCEGMTRWTETAMRVGNEAKMRWEQQLQAVAMLIMIHTCTCTHYVQINMRHKNIAKDQLTPLFKFLKQLSVQFLRYTLQYSTLAKLRRNVYATRNNIEQPTVT